MKLGSQEGYPSHHLTFPRLPRVTESPSDVSWDNLPWQSRNLSMTEEMISSPLG